MSARTALVWLYRAMLAAAATCTVICGRVLIMILTGNSEGDAGVWAVATAVPAAWILGVLMLRIPPKRRYGPP